MTTKPIARLEAELERSQAPARGINCIELLAQCPPLPKEKEGE